MSGFGQPPSGAGGYGAPPNQPGGFGAPPGAPGSQPGGFGTPPAGAPQAGPAGPAPNFVLWIIIGFAQIILCSSPWFGVPAGVLALMAKNEWDQGKFDSAQSKLKISKIISIVGIGLMALVIVSVVIFYAAAIIGVAATNPSSY